MNDKREVLTPNKRVFDVGHDGMDTLRKLFPGGRASAMEFVLFSVTKCFGVIKKIEEVEYNLSHREDGQSLADFGVTFVCVRPNMQNMIVGTCFPGDQADIEFLKSLRETSHEVVATTGI